MPPSLYVVGLAILWLLWPGVAHAEIPTAGRWSQSPVNETYTVQQWFSGCGPAPVSGTADPGGTVTVRAEGNELVITGSGRPFRTDQCLDPMPTLVRQSHSYNAGARTWSTRCATPVGDPRRAAISTSVTATSDTRIEIVETGHYEITLTEGKCSADVRRTRTLVHIPDAAPVAASASANAIAASTASAPPDHADCSSPGEPARLEVRPSHKLLKTGGSFTFRASVRDANGCPTGTPVTWRIEGNASGVHVDGAGKVTVSADAPEGEVEIRVTAAGKSTRVSVEVTTPERYEELLAHSGLSPTGEREEAASVTIATSSIGGGSARAEDHARRRRAIFIGIVSVSALVLGIAALIGVRRAKKRAAAIEREAKARHEDRLRAFEQRKRERAEQHAAQMRAHLESVERAKNAELQRGLRKLEQARAARQQARREGALVAPTPMTSVTPTEAASDGTMVCPACRKEYPPSFVFCGEDAMRLVPLDSGLVSGGLVCPVCRRAFAPGTNVCPEHGEELVPPPLAPRAATPPLVTRGKICPTCGGRFDGSAAFCGQDGTALVLIN